MDYADKLFGPAHQPKDIAAFHEAVQTEIDTLLGYIQHILRLREKDYSYDEIAHRMHIERDQVRQYEAKGLRLLRHPNRGLREL